VENVAEQRFVCEPTVSPATNVWLNAHYNQPKTVTYEPCWATRAAGNRGGFAVIVMLLLSKESRLIGRGLADLDCRAVPCLLVCTRAYLRADSSEI